MTSLVARRPTLYVRLMHTAEHMLHHCDHLAGAKVTPAHLMMVAATALVAAFHNDH